MPSNCKKPLTRLSSAVTVLTQFLVFYSSSVLLFLVARPPRSFFISPAPPPGLAARRPTRQPSPGAANVPTMPAFNAARISVSPAVRRLVTRAVLFFACVWLVRALFGSTPSDEEIQGHGMLERVLMADKHLDVHRLPFLQARFGRDNRPDLFDDEIEDGILDYWTRFQKPHITGKHSQVDTHNMQVVIDDLLKFNGWVTGGCQNLLRPFDSANDNYDDLVSQDHLYYIALLVNNADHFLVDQLAIIVQLARRLGTRNIFVSMLDQGSTDSTATLTDLCEATLTILGISFRIRRIPAVETNYYPLEEAKIRNLVLEPLHELDEKRRIKFHRVIWLKGFTCPMDILESLRVSEKNKAAMVCGMDWAEHNGFFIFSDRWRTRDIAGDLFRQARSNSKPGTGPPRDKVGTERYAEHLPFQVFCCESGTHVVDPEQSYYRGIHYRASPSAVNITDRNELATDPDTPCMDSAQMWFCRDLWIDAAREGGRREGSSGRGHRRGSHKREIGNVVDNFKTIEKRAADMAAEEKRDPQAQVIKAGQVKDSKAKDKEEQRDGPQGVKPGKANKEEEKNEPAAQAADKDGDEGAGGAGTNQDAMDEKDENKAPEALKKEDLPISNYLVSNDNYEAARILVNPRCLTTYGGVSHTRLATDLFGGRHSHAHSASNYMVEEWFGAPDSFVCQEMRTTGGRTAPKSQRRVSFLLQKEVSGTSRTRSDPQLAAR